MSDSTSNLDTVSQSVSQREVQINALFDAHSPASLFGRRASTCAGLVFGYYGGRFNGTSVANGTVTATASNTNYVVAHRTTLVVSIATSSTNWNNTTTYGRMYKLTAGASSITAYEDHRASTDGSGIFSPGGGGGTLSEVPANQSYTGIVVSLTYGESLVPGDPVYVKSDGKVWKADANGSATYPCIGLAMETASSGSHIVLVLGIYRDDSLFAWTVGGIVYLSTGGALTQTAPAATDDVIQIVGIATHADRLYVNPQLNYATHT